MTNQIYNDVVCAITKYWEDQGFVGGNNVDCNLLGNDGPLCDVFSYKTVDTAHCEIALSDASDINSNVGDWPKTRERYEEYVRYMFDLVKTNVAISKAYLLLVAKHENQDKLFDFGRLNSGASSIICNDPIGMGYGYEYLSKKDYPAGYPAMRVYFSKN